MSWASDKAREILGGLGDVPTDPLRVLVERAIRETIARCAEAADDAMSVEGAADHIRKLGEP